MLHGPGGLLATPGMGKRRGRKWGNRTKDAACTCGVVTKAEQLAPGVTRIRGNLCNVHGRYGPCDQSGAANVQRGVSLSQSAAPGKRPATGGSKRAAGGKKRASGGGKAGAKPKKAAATPEQRQAERQTKQAQNRTDTVAKLQSKPNAAAMDALGKLERGEAVDPDMAKALADETGLVDIHADGSATLSSTGRAFLNALDRGDAAAASDAQARAQDRMARSEDRQQAATERKRAADQRKADAEKRRAERQKKRGGGGAKRAAPKQPTPEQQQREAERKRRQQEADARRAQRDTERQQRQTAADQRRAEADRRRAAADQRRQQNDQRRQQNDQRRQAQATQREEQRQRALTDLAQQMEAGNKLSDTELQKLIVEGLAERQGSMIRMTAAGRQQARRKKKLYASEGMEIPAEKAALRVRTAPVIGPRPSYAPITPYAARDSIAPSFAVFKDASGAYRWIARTSTAYRDRDAEIVTTKALENDAARMTATGQYGPLRYWHLGQPDPFNPAAPWGVGVDIGDCDYSIVIGRTAIESGTFKSATIGRAFAASADDYELSRGFFHPPDQPSQGEYADIHTFERSAVPIKYGRASNLFTGMTVKEHRMDQQTYEARVKAFMADMNAKGVPPEVAAQSLASMEQADKSATQQGIAFKSEDAPPDPWAAVVAALKAAVAPVVEAEKAPMMGDAESPMEDMAEPGEAPGEGDYVGDMAQDAFFTKCYDTCLKACQDAMAPMMKTYADMKLSEFKDLLSSVATKDAGTIARIAQLETELATLKGDQPAVVESEALAALKSKGPQAPPDASAPQIPDDPNRPLAGLGAQLLPHLYGAAAPQVQGFAGANGWQLNQPQPNTGGN